MLNGKLKSHHELWYALLDAEKLFSTKDPQVGIFCSQQGSGLQRNTMYDCSMQSFMQHHEGATCNT